MTSKTNPLITLLKKKGTGPKMGNALSTQELDLLIPLLQAQEGNLTTKATLLTALLTLPPSDAEQTVINTLKKNAKTVLSLELQNLIPHLNPNTPFLSLIHTLIDQKDLSEKEALLGCQSLFDNAIPTYQKAAFLEGLRLKRETDIENHMCFRALWEQTHHAQIEVPFLLNIADPYDGFNRYPYLNTFVAPLLASIGIPTLLHGVDEVGPKKGINTYKILINQAKNPHHTSTAIMDQLTTPSIGWGYLDQRQYSPNLYKLKSLRINMVKRPLLSTLEKILFPIQSRTRNGYIVSYTHPPYRKTLDTLLKTIQKTDTYVIVRGIEGSCQLPLDRRAPYLTSSGDENQKEFIHPSTFDIQDYPDMKDPNITVNACTKLGVEALKGHPGYAKNSLLYLALFIVSKLDIMPIKTAKKALLNSLDNGLALSHWEKGCPL